MGLKKNIKKRVAVLKEEMKVFLSQANERLAGYQTAIAELEVTLKPGKPKAKPRKTKETEPKSL